jgi:hypothetical protein
VTAGAMFQLFGCIALQQNPLPGLSERPHDGKLFFAGSRQHSKQHGNNPHSQMPAIPWFTVGFMAVSGFNTFDWLPKWLVSEMVNADLFFCLPWPRLSWD